MNVIDVRTGERTTLKDASIADGFGRARGLVGGALMGTLLANQIKGEDMQKITFTTLCTKSSDVWNRLTALGYTPTSPYMFVRCAPDKETAPYTTFVYVIYPYFNLTTQWGALQQKYAYDITGGSPKIIADGGTVNVRISAGTEFYVIPLIPSAATS